MDKNNAPTSDLSSLDCWDYTIELECLRGPQGIIIYNNKFQYRKNCVRNIIVLNLFIDV